MGARKQKQDPVRDEATTVTCQHCRYERPAGEGPCPHCGYPWPWLKKGRKRTRRG